MIDDEDWGPEDLELHYPATPPALRSKRSEAELALTSPAPAPSQRPPISLLHEVTFVITILLAQILLQAGVGQGLAPLHIKETISTSRTPAS